MSVAMTDSFEVDNPAGYAERAVNPKITATRMLRDDPIGHMHSRGHLGSLIPEMRELADGRLGRARLFQEVWEASGRGRIGSGGGGLESIGSSDPSRKSGITDRQLRAARRLTYWEADLGKAGFGLLVSILIDKRTVAEAARHAFGVVSKATITYTGHRLRECLDALS